MYAITFIIKRKKYSQTKTYDRLTPIIRHTTLTALQQYLRDINTELPNDYSYL